MLMGRYRSYLQTSMSLKCRASSTYGDDIGELATGLVSADAHRRASPAGRHRNRLAASLADYHHRLQRWEHARGRGRL